ncbi:MAG: hypothetical protein MHM6MM_000838 [Cercozoa sp. M6MM]
MSHFLAPSLLSLFAPRPPLPHLPYRKGTEQESFRGVAGRMAKFAKQPKSEEQEKTDEVIKLRDPKAEKKAAAEAKVKAHAEELEKKLAEWKPSEMPADIVTKNPLKTLFVGRLNYSIEERDLRDFFASYGDVRSVRLVRDPATGKSRGYGFVEFERTSAFEKALDRADGTEILGRHIVVDVERGRTVPDWKPRRLGGGLGLSRLGGKDDNIVMIGRFDVDKARRMLARRNLRRGGDSIFGKSTKLKQVLETIEPPRSSRHSRRDRSRDRRRRRSRSRDRRRRSRSRDRRRRY